MRWMLVLSPSANAKFGCPLCASMKLHSPGHPFLLNSSHTPSRASANLVEAFFLEAELAEPYNGDMVRESKRAAMKTFQVEVNVPDDRRLMIELPEDVAAGSYQVVLVLNPTTPTQPVLSSEHQLNTLAGQVKSFADCDAVDWQRQIRAAWDSDE